MPRVLILGAGQVGTFSARAIAEEGVSVIAADISPNRDYFARFGPREGADLLAADILDSMAMSTLIETNAIDVVVLTAGLLSENCARDARRAWEVNVHGTEVVAQVALERGVKRLVFISSFAVYNRTTSDPVKESEPIRPQALYGYTKAAAENALVAYRNKGLDVRILRACGVYGPLRRGAGSHSARFIESLLLHAASGLELIIKTSNTVVDEYLYVKDLAGAITLATLCDTNSPEFVFNVGWGRRTTIQELCAAIQQVIPDTRITIEIANTDSGPPMASLDVSRIRAIFGFEPAYSLVEGLSDYLQEVGLHCNDYVIH